MIPMWIKGLSRKYGIEIKRIRLDNSGENRSLQKECDKQNLGVIFKLTAPGTPQQNSIVERKIPTLVGRARAMLIHCRILGLTTFNSLLQYVNRLGFEICSVNRTRKLGYVTLNWTRCSAQVTESLALTDGSFCRKQNTLYFRLCKNCEFYDMYFDCGSSIQSYASLVFLGMHASRKVQSWEKVSHILE